MASNGHEIIDTLIIGGGPAGHAAAVSIARNVHTAVLFDSHEYRNGHANHMHMIPTWDGRDPEDFREAARKNTGERYPLISFVDAKITKAKRLEDETFEIEDGEGKTWRGKSLVLATGVEDVLVDPPGLDECWGKSIYHCLFCFGYENRGSSSSGILWFDDDFQLGFVQHMARNGAQLSDAVTIYTNGSTKRAESFAAATVENEPFKVDSRRIAKFELGPTGSGVLITFEDGSTRAEGFLAHKPIMKLRNTYLAEQLGLETTPTGDIKVIPPFGETSVPGCFAAGDNSSTFKMISNAIHAGALAASGVASHVQSRLYGQKGMSDVLRAAAAAKEQQK
ncbi:unnamed protein product [Periconia digitata]|uniref:FAD/NAD(P)-binding domain-containing protein n=1 Tax=Periconia digitata TaxID=1303443 RepID=A0A9W4XD49_9PLEO|nr:unnamed protein product [Periconia digitata]